MTTCDPLGTGSFGLLHYWVNENLSWCPVLGVLVDEAGIVVLINMAFCISENFFMTERAKIRLLCRRLPSTSWEEEIRAPLLLSSCSGFYFCLSGNVLGSEQWWLRQRHMPLPAARFHRGRKHLVAGEWKWAAPRHLPSKDEAGAPVRSRQTVSE